MNGMERAYFFSEMSTPAGRARLRNSAAKRHAQSVWRRAQAGEFRHMTNLEWLAELRSHSRTIDDFYDEGGWRTI